MTTRLKLKAGARGTKRLTAEYGDKLVCVRYRYDLVARKRYKTVEIIVEEIDWSPLLKYSENALVPVRIEYSESLLQEKIKSLGGKWNPIDKVWYVRYGLILGTNLEKRIKDIS